jgi:hypothetical protein
MLISAPIRPINNMEIFKKKKMSLKITIQIKFTLKFKTFNANLINFVRFNPSSHNTRVVTRKKPPKKKRIK